MIPLLQITLAQKLATATGQVAYTPGETGLKNLYMDDVVIKRIDSVKESFDMFENMEESEKYIMATHLVYEQLKNERFINPFLKSHVESFKSVGSFVGYYKSRLGLNRINTEG